MRKHDIKVILDENNYNKALEILNKYNEPICKYGLFINSMWKTLYYNGYNWSIALIKNYQTEISLEQLEELLIKEQQTKGLFE
jgi:hypothetical protein